MKAMVSLLIPVALVAVIVIVSPAEAVDCTQICQQDKGPSYGTVLSGSTNPYQGVTAYSNGNWTGCGCGEYQCVQYVKRFYSTVYGVTLGSPGGTDGAAKNYYLLYSSGNNLQNLGFARYANGETSDLPQRDDLLVFNSSGYGHVAIITGVTSGQVTIIEQNGSASNANRQLTMTKPSGKYSIDSGSPTYSVLGWLRINVGRYSDGWHGSFCPSSQPFLDAYLAAGGYEGLGPPYDSGGGEYVHSWWGVYVQEFQQDFPLYETSALMMDPNGEAVYAVKGKMWALYKNWALTSLALGYPTSDEYACDDGLLCQDFHLGRLNYDPDYNDGLADFNDLFSQYISTVEDEGNPTTDIPQYTLPCLYGWQIPPEERYGPDYYCGQIYNGPANVCGAQGWQMFWNDQNLTRAHLAHCCSGGEKTRGNGNCVLAGIIDSLGTTANRYNVQLTNTENYPLQIEAGKTYLFSAMVRNDSPRNKRTITVVLTPRATYDTFGSTGGMADLLAPRINFTIQNLWQHISYHFTATRTDYNAAIRVFFGDLAGGIRLDDVHLAEVPEG